MITIIHGTNQTATRNQLLLLKKQFSEIIVLDGRNITKDILLQNLENYSLFESKKLVVVENMFVGRADRKDLVNYILTGGFTSDLVFWEGAERKTKDLLTLSAKAKVIKLNISTIIFKFLDTLNISLIDRVFNEIEPEVVLFMMIKQIRYLILAKQTGDIFPDDYKRLASWQIDKLTKQAQSFTLERLIDIYQKLMEIDYKNKSGQTQISLGDQIKLFLTLEL